MPVYTYKKVVSISRDGTLLIPRGSTQLLSGDKVIVLCRNTALHQLGKILGLEQKR